MASPQKENGYTAIANEIIEKLCLQNLSGSDWSIIMILLRKTYGFHKKSDEISLTDFARLTGIHWVHISKSIKRLLLANMLTLSKNAKGFTRSYCFQKDFDKWTTLSKYAKGKSNPKQTCLGTLSKPAKGPLANLLYTKETFKETFKDKERTDTNVSGSIESDPTISDLIGPISEHRKTPVEKKNREANELIRFYITLYKKKYDFKDRTLRLNGKAVGIALRLLKDFSLPVAMDLVQTYLSMNDQWFITRAHDLATLEQNLNKVQVKMNTGRTVTQDFARSAEKKSENREALKRFAERGQNGSSNIPEGNNPSD